MTRKFLVIYSALRSNSWGKAYSEHKAVVVYDDAMELPFGYEPTTLGPDEDEVDEIIAITDVTAIEDLHVYIADRGYTFDVTGAPIADEVTA